MKKTYISPSMATYAINLNTIVAASPQISGGPGAGETITTENSSGFTQDSRNYGTSIWDSEW